MKKRKMMSMLLALAVIICMSYNSIPSYAYSATWMEEATKIPINTPTQTYELQPQDYLNPALYDAFYFYLPTKLHTNILLNVKGSRKMDWILYNDNGEKVGSSSAKLWKYNKNTNTNQCSGWITLNAGGYYIKFDMWGCGRDAFYASFNIKTYIPTTTKVQSIKRGKNRVIKLTWNKASGAEGYIVYRAIPGKKYVKIKEVKGNKGFTNISKVPQNKTYMYHVEAYRTINGKRVFSAGWKSKKYNYTVK